MTQTPDTAERVFEDFMGWFNSLSERLAPKDPTGSAQEKLVWSPHEQMVQDTVELLSVATGLAHYRGDREEDLEQTCGAMHLQALRRAVDDTDAERARAFCTELSRLVAQQRSTDDVDVDELKLLADRLMDCTRQLRDAAMAVGNRADEESTRRMLTGFEMAARDTPGVQLRVTEVMQGPDGRDTVLRDTMAIGPDADNPAPALGFRRSSTQVKALGMDHDRAATDAERVFNRRMQLATDRLSLTSSTAANHDTIREHLVDPTLRDAQISSVIGDTPHPMLNLLPGHAHALRMNLLEIARRGLEEGAVRGARGDASAAHAGWQLAAVGLALTQAAVYYLPAGRLAQTRTSAPARLSPGEHLVFHDSPLEGPAGMDMLAWVFSTDEAGLVDDVAHVVTVEQPGSLEMALVNLAAGDAAVLGRRVLATLTDRSWSTTKRRRLPGRPGDHAWTSTLGRVSTSELRTGSLARVHQIND